MKLLSPKTAKVIVILFLFSLGFSGVFLGFPDYGVQVAQATHDEGVFECDDGEDNDGDSEVDGEDPGCDEGEGGVFDEEDEPECHNGLDDDGDDATDEEDFSCLDEDGTYDPDDDDESSLVSECQDWEDNDGDGDVDEDDRGCYDLQDNDESNHDFGDAPDDGDDFYYDTLLENGGARHEILPRIDLRLGDTVDAEDDGQPTTGADGDDTDDNGDDEDGVTFPDPFVACEEADVTVTVTGEGDEDGEDSVDDTVLDVWFDWDRNGEFDEDTALHEHPELGDTETYEVEVPCDAEPGTTYARFRLYPGHYESGDPDGGVEGGEVEDYRVTVYELDFGDAPDGEDGGDYRTTRDNDGARHAIVEGLNLGETIDAEEDGQPSFSADGDDDGVDGEDDEDGVSFPDPFNPCGETVINFMGVGTGRLDGWIDWDRDGEFDDDEESSEHVIDTGLVSLSLVSVTPITVSVPCSAETDDEEGSEFTYARFRLSTVDDSEDGEDGEDGEGDGLEPYGLAPDGEVEDYTINVREQCRDGFDNDSDGSSDSDDFSCNQGEDGEDGEGAYDPSDNDEGDPLAQCQDGGDNEPDGASDSNDFSCFTDGVYNAQDDDESSPLAQCQDTLDNDGDGTIDLTNIGDPGCPNNQDNSEDDATTQCQDGLDNDADGLIDLADPGCASAQDGSESDGPAGGVGGGGTGGGGGSGGGSRGVGAALGFGAGGAPGGFGGVPPGGFGGVLSDETVEQLCDFRENFPRASNPAIALAFSQFFGIDADVFEDALNDPDLCEGGGSASRGHIPVAFSKPILVDEKGVVVTGNPAFNACLRSTMYFGPDTEDSHPLVGTRRVVSKPVACSRFVNDDRLWAVPGYGPLEMTWNHHLSEYGYGFNLPRGYRLFVLKRADRKS